MPKSTFCQFCKIINKNQSSLLYKDDHFFAIHDIDKSSARQHVLVCTVDHIQTATDINDKNVIYQMREVGTRVLDQLCCSNEGSINNYRFGFHLRPYNSIDHVHLHCFVLPFNSFIRDKIVYGKLLTSVQQAQKAMVPKL